MNGKESPVYTVMLTTVPYALFIVPTSLKCAKWVIKSPFTRHMTSRRHNVSNFSACKSVVQVGNNETSLSYGYGDIKVVATVGGLEHRIVLQRVFSPLKYR